MLGQKEALADKLKADLDELTASKEAADTELAELKKEAERLTKVLQSSETGKRALNADILLQENKLLKTQVHNEKRLAAQREQDL